MRGGVDPLENVTRRAQRRVVLHPQEHVPHLRRFIQYIAQFIPKPQVMVDVLYVPGTGSVE